LIEIHGGGGKGIHWTDGCVALENRDMDMLYRLVPVGCPVLIVGSLHSLDEVQKSKTMNMEDQIAETIDL
jgi:hypothetical protein